MNVVRFDPFKELRNLESKMINLYGENKEKNNLVSFMPSISTREDEKHYYVDVDLPGVKKEEIDIDVQENTLVIAGERRYKEQVEEKDYYRSESAFGKFQRSFALPDNVDTQNITATCTDGVLEVVIPKSEPKDKRKIEIQ